MFFDIAVLSKAVKAITERALLKRKRNEAFLWNSGVYWHTCRSSPVLKLMLDCISTISPIFRFLKLCNYLQWKKIRGMKE